MICSEIIINEDYVGINPCSFGYQDCTACHSYGPAVRTHWLLHYVVSGTGIFRREGQEYSLRAGDVFVIPPFLETYYEADAQQPWRYIWVGFTSDIPMPAAFDNAILQHPGMGSIFKSMRRCNSMQRGKSAFLTSRIWEMFSVLLESDKQENDYVKQAIHYMNAEYMTEISVAGLAHRLNLDRCYFSSLFTRQIGTSPSQYLVNLRLEKAAELMLCHGQTPSVAAASVGYPDIYHFSKMFKKKYGCSPRQYLQTGR